MKLNIGVIDYQYTGHEKAVTTGDVAQILEKRYAVMTGFAVTYLSKIADDMAESYAGALESILMGGPPGNPAAQATSKIASRAKNYLSSMEAERVLAPGTEKFPVPTHAAIMGINHRKKKPRTGIRRPSFIDTGMYQNSLIAWTEE